MMIIIRDAIVIVNIVIVITTDIVIITMIRILSTIIRRYCNCYTVTRSSTIYNRQKSNNYK